MLWPFSWSLMDSNRIQVVAAAPGTLSCKIDGNYDRECSLNNLDANLVCIDHDDGSTALYAHLQSGSTTPKPLGSLIETGEVLGRVGSSGFSTGPHLHFELNDSSGAYIDPFAGPCGREISQWAEQPAYYDSAVNKLATHDQPPDFKFEECNAPEEPHLSNRFEPGATIHCAAYYRDQLGTQETTYVLRRPNGSVWKRWSSRPDQVSDHLPHYQASYWYWSWILPRSGQRNIGSWQFEASFEGETTTHVFTVPEPGSEQLAVATSPQ